MLDKENRLTATDAPKPDSVGNFLKKGSRQPPYRPSKSIPSARTPSDLAPKHESKQGQARRNKAKPEAKSETKAANRPVMQEVNQPARAEADKKQAVPQAALPLQPSTPSVAKPITTDSAKEDIKTAGRSISKEDSAQQAENSDSETPERSNIYIPPAQRTKTPEAKESVPNIETSKAANGSGPHSAPPLRGPFPKTAAKHNSPTTGPPTPNRQYPRTTYHPYTPRAYYNEYQTSCQQPGYPPYSTYPNFYDPAVQYSNALYPYFPPQYTELYEHQSQRAGMDPRYEIGYDSSDLLAQRMLTLQLSGPPVRHLPVSSHDFPDNCTTRTPFIQPEKAIAVRGQESTKQCFKRTNAALIQGFVLALYCICQYVACLAFVLQLQAVLNTMQCSDTLLILTRTARIYRVHSCGICQILLR